MKMYEIEVALNAGDVWIAQDDGNGGTAVVAVHPDQIDLLCEWLKDAALACKEVSQKETQR